MKHQKFTVLLATTILMTSCAGRTPNPVPMYSPGDDALSCEGLRIQMGYAEEQVATLLPKSEKTGSNVALGIAGAFLLVPWFFMDFSEADKVEMNAWRARYNYLTSLFVDKGCGQRMAMPTIKQMKNDESLREKWAEQVEFDQEFLHAKEADNFADLEDSAKATGTSISSKLHSMDNSSRSDSTLMLSAHQYEIAKDRLLSLYTTGDIDKKDFDREMEQLDDARNAYRTSENSPE